MCHPALWLKNENQPFWNEIIGSDEFYSQFIILAIPSNLVNQLLSLPQDIPQALQNLKTQQAPKNIDNIQKLDKLKKIHLR
jgi:hypothetical protein